MKLLIAFVVLLLALTACSQESSQETAPEIIIYDYEDFVDVIQKNDPASCLKFTNETINESLKKYVNNLLKVEDDILFKDICLIYTISLTQQNGDTIITPNLNDEGILLCNKASTRVYDFCEEGCYGVPAWEFCLKMALNQFMSYPQSPSRGNIQKKETCREIPKFQDSCFWIVAKNGDLSACDEMLSERNRERCRETFEAS